MLFAQETVSVPENLELPIIYGPNMSDQGSITVFILQLTLHLTVKVGILYRLRRFNTLLLIIFSQMFNVFSLEMKLGNLSDFNSDKKKDF